MPKMNGHYQITKKWPDGRVETKTVRAGSLKNAWVENIDEPLPKRSQNYQGSDRTSSYYYGVHTAEKVWILVEKL